MENSDNTLINDVQEELIESDSTDTSVNDEVAQLQSLLEAKKEEARKANFKVEMENKYSKQVESLKEELEMKVKAVQESLLSVVASELSKTQDENKELRKMLDVKDSEVANTSTQPILSNGGKRSDGLDESKIEHYRRLLKK